MSGGHPTDDVTGSTTVRRADVSADPPGTVANALVVLFSPDPEAVGLVRPLSREPLTLGRKAPPPSLVFRDRLASRRHARVVWSEERRGHLVVDAGSANGTFLGGRRVQRERLSPGDVLRIGDTVLRAAQIDPTRAGWRPPSGCLMAGASEKLREVVEDIHRVARTDLSVLFAGETGTGKELAARELHRASGRSGGFVPVNCAALPHELVESELFGYAKGAFSGAVSSQIGLVRSAEGGTLFLDEVGELALAAQAKLLRVLEEKRVRPVGTTAERSADVRFVFATNRDLSRCVSDDEFRADLFARLDQWQIVLPPLRERPEDILPILEAVAARHAEGKTYTLSGDFVEALALYDWPYNVRELVSRFRRALLLLPEGGTLGLAQLPAELRPEPPPAEERTPPAPAEHELPPRGVQPTRDELVRLLEHYGGNVSEVARHTSRSRMQVYRWLKRHGLDSR